MNSTMIWDSGLPLDLTVPFTSASLGPLEQPTTPRTPIRTCSGSIRQARVRMGRVSSRRKGDKSSPSRGAAQSTARGRSLASIVWNYLATLPATQSLQDGQGGIGREEDDRAVGAADIGTSRVLAADGVD